MQRLRTKLTTQAMAIAVAMTLFPACEVAGADTERATIDDAHASRVLAQMHLIHHMVLEAARAAETRAENQDVRDYARRLRMDHAFADRRVQTLARGLHIDLDDAAKGMQQRMWHTDASPDSGAAQPLQDQQLQELLQLRGAVAHLDLLEGSAFDDRFVQVMERANQLAVYHIAAAHSGVEEPVQDLLSRVVPILAQHVQLAWSLQPDPRRATGGA